MNCYKITANGQSLGQVWAISPGSAIIAWRLALFPVFRPECEMRAERVNDIADDIASLTLRHLPGALTAFGDDVRYAYRHARAFARDCVARDRMGEHNGRNA